MENFETILILMVVVWVAGKVFRALSLPVIFGELLGGIIVGPLVLGLIDGDSEVVKILADLGIFFLMLHAGLETDPNKLMKASKKSILVAIGGVIVPFAAGYFVGQIFGSSFEESLFIAMGLSITAISITIRLFKENKIQGTTVAHIALGAAIVDDIIALVMFSVILTIAETGSIEMGAILILLAKVIAFFVVIMGLGFKFAKFMPKVLRKKGFTFALIVALAIGLLAEAIGLHIIIGAFMAGLFIRKEVVDEKVYNKIEDRIYGLSYSFLGPIFFASLAFYIDLTAFYTAPLFLTAVIVAAIGGKVIGAGGAAYLQKVNLRKSAIIGLAMNSRGAVELIIASIGVREGIIGSDVFSILVIMAFVTTIFSIFIMKPLAKYA